MGWREGVGWTGDGRWSSARHLPLGRGRASKVPVPNSIVWTREAIMWDFFDVAV